MKKALALILAGAMVFATPVIAANSPSAEAVSSQTSAAIEKAAAEVGMTAGEYVNNAVVSTPGLDNAAQVGQGGHIILNGAPSNVTFQLVKANITTVNAAKALAATLNGNVLNVVTTKSTVAKFDTARVNFYVKGVKTGQTVVVYQLVNGQWLPLTLAEVRDDHVVVDMTGHGTLAFVTL